MMCQKISVLLILCVSVLCVSEINGYKILGVFPFFAPSHYFLGNELIKGLAEAGHDVTMVTVFEEKNPPKNGKYRQIVMHDLGEKQKALFSTLTNFNDTEATHKFFSNPFTMINRFMDLCAKVTELSLQNTKMQQLIKSKEKFDAVIIPQFNLEAIKALAPHFGAHLVIFNNHASNSWMNHFVGNPTLPSINPEVLLGYTGQMSFKQRFLNMLLSVAQYLLHNFSVYPTQTALVHKYISKDLDLTSIQYNVSLVLSNSHVSISKAAGSVPCMKEIAGFHVKPPKKLPADLQKYFDDAKEGVIYFSMGSNLQGANLPLNIRQELMKTFSKRKEKVLWKFENADMPGKPNNVRIEKWLPQSDILAHPNLKLFITHGGFLSTIETVYHGIPTVAIPVLGDQLKNAKLAESDGYTRVVEFNNLKEEVLSSAIEEVLSNKKYLENVKHRSKLFHDRQIKPIDEAVYWLEYIIRHNGAQHLRVDYLGLNWFEYYLLDVFAVSFSVIFVALFITKKVLCYLVSLCKGKSNKTKTKKSKKD